MLSIARSRFTLPSQLAFLAYGYEALNKDGALNQDIEPPDHFQSSADCESSNVSRKKPIYFGVFEEPTLFCYTVKIVVIIHVCWR